MEECGEGSPTIVRRDKDARAYHRGCAIIAAGDDDRSIYSFCNAAPAGIRRFCADYPGSATYPLSITQRCGSRIIEWASYIIAGDLGRPADRPTLRSAEGSPPGEVALTCVSGREYRSARRRRDHSSAHTRSSRATRRNSGTNAGRSQWYLQPTDQRKR